MSETTVEKRQKIAEATAEQRRKIIEEVGRCIMEWASVERGLTILYGECVGRPIGPPSFWLDAGVFDSVISLDARLDMIEAAMDFRIQYARVSIKPPALNAEIQTLAGWAPLKNKIKKKYKKRNEVAHCDISETGLADGTSRVGLQPFPTLSSAMRGPPFGAAPRLLSLKDLVLRTASFSYLGGDISKFRQQVAVALARFPKVP